jgi:hypothetical protein
MPYPETPNETDFDYGYPQGLNLRPGSELHDNIVSKVMDYADSSWEVMNLKYDKWREIDQKHGGFIPADDEEKVRRAGKAEDWGDVRKFMSIVIPYSAATKQTLLAYLAKRFLMGPAIRYVGQGPEDMLAAKKLEIVANQQFNYLGAGENCHRSFDDALKYGFGAVSPDYVREERMVTRPRVSTEFSRMMDRVPIAKKFSTVRRKELRFEGTALVNLDPYRCLPDPRVPIDQCQKGEFFGFFDTENIMSMLGNDGQKDGYFNVKYVRMAGAGTESRFALDNSGRGYTRSQKGETVIIRDDLTQQRESSHPLLVRMYIKLIPREWKLGDGTDPEIWSFVVANDTFLVKLTRHDANHGLFPVAIAAPLSDGYSLLPTSFSELVLGLQETLDALVNTHWANIFKANNDMIIYDPKIIRDDDMRKSAPGLRARIRSQFWGAANLDNAVKQLNVHDVTRGHMQDVPMVMDWINRAYCTPDQTQGVIRAGGERRSAAEFDTATSMAVTRQEHIAWIIETQYMKRVAEFYAENAQQYMSSKGWYRALGDWPEVLREQYGDGPVQVSQQDILVPYDVVTMEGRDTMGGEDASLTLQALELVLRNPIMITEGGIDPVGIFFFWMRQRGARNLDQFRQKKTPLQPPQMQTMMDGQLDQQVQAGNMVPLAEAMGGNGQPMMGGM